VFTSSDSGPIRVAVLDLYEGTANVGMQNILDLIAYVSREYQQPIEYKKFDIRAKCESPGLDYDAYISSGGPGSPIDSAGAEWESVYFGLMEDIQHYNESHPDQKKHVLLICHSFQIYCRYYGYGHVSKRRSTSFGVMPVHKTRDGAHDPLLNTLADPFWAVDSRDYQITQPDDEKIHERGGAVLCVEKYRPHVVLERAVMAIRFDEAFVGMQFHPEAESQGMRMYLLSDEKKNLVMGKYGEAKYQDMLNQLTDPDKISLTNQTVVPRFLALALRHRLQAVSL
jgi:GMP synthase-like glutamine amidotransferase